jgi:F420H(2)-dependent quinone reductase
VRGRLGASPLGVWGVKHIVSPVHRWAFRATGGRAFRHGRLGRSIPLLTPTGRHTGKVRATPVFFLRDADSLVVCNVNPGSERANPWVLNLRANPNASVQIGADVLICRAREIRGAELERYWPRFVALWPAYQRRFLRSGDRSVFVLRTHSALAPERQHLVEAGDQTLVKSVVVRDRARVDIDAQGACLDI